MQQFRGLRLDRRDDLGRAVAGVEHADPTDKIDEGVAVHIGHQRALSALDSDLVGFVEAIGHGSLAAGDEFARARAGDCGANADAASDRRVHTASSALSSYVMVVADMDA